MGEHWGQAEDRNNQFFIMHFEEKAEIKREMEKSKSYG